MNPIVTVVLFMLLYQENNNFPNYYDTFKLEKVLDKLNFAVQSLDRINHLNELAHEPFSKGHIADTLQDSLHTVKPLLPEGKHQNQLESVASVIDGIKKIGGLQNMVKTLGPVMGMLNNMQTSALPISTNTDDEEYNPYDFGKSNEKEDPYF